jgi:hypothetical protein
MADTTRDERAAFWLRRSGRKYAILSIDESSAMLSMSDRDTDTECLAFDVTDDRCIDVLQRVDFWLQTGIDPVSGRTTNA